MTIFTDIGGQGNSGNSLSNVAGIAQSNNQQGQQGGIGVGNVVGILQNNLGGSQGNSGSSQSNVASIAQSNNQQGQQGGIGIGNIAGIVQTSKIVTDINGLQGIGNIGQNNVGGIQGISNVANIGQSNYPYDQGINGQGYNNNQNFYYNYNNFLRNNLNNNNNNNAFDNERNIERPCQVFDTYCIRKYFADHSKCRESQGPVPDPMYRPQTTLYLPRVNLTVTVHDALYSGLNGRIEEFYVNKETDKLVLTIEFRNVTFYSKDAYYRFHRRAREPIVNVDYIYVNFQSVVSTIIIPQRNDLQLEKSESVSFISIPTVRLGPNAFNSQDPVVQLSRNMILADAATDAQEAQLTESPYYTSTFIQYSLCDFGLKVL
ncbi:uncharacterized protein DDB_G0280315-like [Melitaea cinxia]|uniref:uncharacterized protein DDB_G0280315-like n=1 Tax=Melitaea cinxia TaxID=113334 RepID=UPI001E272E59|nr:uncharacterized protein DDB_G0280315-like [Melitaea cinxia]